MVRIQLHLTEEQDSRLRALAQRQGLTRAELIRQGIDRVLDESDSGRDPLLDLVGSAGHAIAPAVSEDHDAYVSGPIPEPELMRVAEPRARLLTSREREEDEP